MLIKTLRSERTNLNIQNYSSTLKGVINVESIIEEHRPSPRCTNIFLASKLPYTPNRKKVYFVLSFFFGGGGNLELIQPHLNSVELISDT
uniref:Uncharacterized protein n=1 Tax=Rhizophora mucronata TaxID=61149 RepID=A0A2P2MQR6_RHIMU